MKKLQERKSIRRQKKKKIEMKFKTGKKRKKKPSGEDMLEDDTERKWRNTQIMMHKARNATSAFKTSAN